MKNQYYFTLVELIHLSLTLISAYSGESFKGALKLHVNVRHKRRMLTPYHKSIIGP